ncbi:MAG: NPCBM/NEW2 domain-containing protein [Pirellulales bacterium]|nr:NPCBM/NEW2 domain-containing protein [Pirellulales bacterium]
MENETAPIAEARLLAEAVCSGSIAPEQSARLNALLKADEEAALTYAVYVRMHGLLCWHWQDQVAIVRTPPSPPAPIPAGLFGNVWQGTVGFFSQTMPLSYLIATVTLAVMLLGAWSYKVSHDLPANGAIAHFSPPGERPHPIFVGRITGMKDCRWADPDTRTIVGASVPLDRKYALASGLIEITHKTGAKVILEGPCAYTVESSAGGFLARGKLTARIGERGEGRGGRTERVSKSPNPQSQTPNPFVVRTPTAIITDLGTEFGVEVAENGDTTSHVFKGSVQVKILPSPAGSEGKKLLPSPASGRGAGGEGGVVQLAAGESVMLSRVRAGTHQNSTPTETLRFTHPTTPPEFVRRIYEPPKMLDLLDIVAGGNGLGNRREHGINPGTGAVDFEISRNTRGGSRIEDRPYASVVWSYYIDGVFVPSGGAGPVRLDSAGHTFNGFPATSGTCFGSIWSRASRAPDKNDRDANVWFNALGRGGQYMPNDRGLLCMHANTGITFDLSLIWKTGRAAERGRFKAVAGVADARHVFPEADGSADLWIFVDGALKWKRVQLRPADGPAEIDVELDPANRFLTLAVTDGGRKRCWPWAVFGDPVLEMEKTEVNSNK